MSSTERHLALCFEPPEGYVGSWAWMCGYSADATFMDHAVERFTRISAAQRAHDGRAWMALLLDRGCPYVSSRDAPGVVHLRFPERLPFALLHAKVALLTFVPETRGQVGWCARLVVSTGNWTRQSWEESLDLYWTLDLSSAELDAMDDDVRRSAADLLAAHTLLSELCERADTSLLDLARGPVANLTRTAVVAHDARMAQVANAAGRQGPTRFVDSRRASLLDGIVAQAERVAGRRNVLVMGSGFYEAGTNDVPEVPRRVAESLRARSLVTASSSVALVVEPAACQAIAHALGTEAWQRTGWNCHAAHDPHPGRGGRKLHAKFLFAGWYQERSPSCGQAWLYLGSGNLTQPGMLHRAGEHGNLEAGVVLHLPGHSWEQTATWLPMRWKDKLLEATATAAGDGMPERPEVHAPPLPFLELSARDGSVFLQAPEHAHDASVDVLDPAGHTCVRTPEGWLWPAGPPAEVEVSWPHPEGARRALVPVLDATGRIGAHPMPRLRFSEVVPDLAAFPLPTPEDELADQDERQDGDLTLTTTPSASESSPPIHRAALGEAARLCEAIGAIQATVGELDWTAWCVRLRQTLERVSDDPVVTYLREIALDPLPVLAVDGFLPDHALKGPSFDAHAAVLADVRAAWRLTDAAPLTGGDGP